MSNEGTNSNNDSDNHKNQCIRWKTHTNLSRSLITISICANGDWYGETLNLSNCKCMKQKDKKKCTVSKELIWPFNRWLHVNDDNFRKQKIQNTHNTHTAFLFLSFRNCMLCTEHTQIHKYTPIKCRTVNAHCSLHIAIWQMNSKQKRQKNKIANVLASSVRHVATGCALRRQMHRQCHVTWTWIKHNICSDVLCLVVFVHLTGVWQKVTLLFVMCYICKLSLATFSSRKMHIAHTHPHICINWNEPNQYFPNRNRCHRMGSSRIVRFYHLSILGWIQCNNGCSSVGRKSHKWNWISYCRTRECKRQVLNEMLSQCEMMQS